MAETTLPKYRVKPGQSINQNGRVFQEGEELEIEPHVAIEFRSLIEPVDPANAFPERKSDVRQGPQAEKAHERAQVLEAREKSLEAQLAMVKEQKQQLQHEIDREQQQKPKPAAPKAASPAPAEAKE